MCSKKFTFTFVSCIAILLLLLYVHLSKSVIHGSYNNSGTMNYIHGEKCLEGRVYSLMSITMGDKSVPQMGTFISCENGDFEFWGSTKGYYPLKNIIPINLIFPDGFIKDKKNEI
uniref:Uncharacterized protein n=1 Tax=Moumouvirus sp. 'Monve' TaxID=1128131 RepID=H2ECZ3_9VIRU|nr:hypothetical protein mv_L61 [Moumouvirus Monve]